MNAAQPSSMKDIENLQKNWKALLAERYQRCRSPSEPLKLSKEEWRKRLDPTQFNVLREEGTEPPGTSLAEQRKAARCICLRRLQPGALYLRHEIRELAPAGRVSSPRYPASFANKTDYKLILPRSEYHCVRCGGHHGHVFDDGPPPTGKRWCNNGVALRLSPS